MTDIRAGPPEDSLLVGAMAGIGGDPRTCRSPMGGWGKVAGNR
jgi:hypothetical protein